MTIPSATAAIMLASIVLTLQPRGRLSDGELREVGELVAAADQAATGESAEDTSFQLQAHSLRAPDGRGYVPFSLVLQDLPDGTFTSVAIYIRVARRGDRTTSAERNRPIGPAGVAVPVFAFDAAAAASAALRLLDRPDQPNPGAYPFEAVHFTPIWWSGRTGVIRRAFSVPPGAYDVYVVVREREHSVWPGETPRSTVVKREVDVPDFSTRQLAISSPILADRVEPLARPLEPDQQAARPYALGTAEIVPALTAVFRPSDTPSIVFMVYNARIGNEGKPDVEIRYTFFRRADGGERPAGSISALYNRDSLPTEFDLRAGHEIVSVQQLSLASLIAGDYRLAMTVTDRTASQSASQNVRFKMVP